MKNRTYKLYQYIQRNLPDFQKASKKDWEEQTTQRLSKFRLFLYKNYPKIKRILIFAFLVVGLILCGLIKLLLEVNKPLANLIAFVGLLLMLLWLIVYECFIFLTPRPRFYLERIPGHLLGNYNKNLNEIYDDCIGKKIKLIETQG